jgi:N-acetylglucosaminyldiphosphoundecaprenol N-acetyl-beta-D-mannosaminyltransferase
MTTAIDWTRHPFLQVWVDDLPLAALLDRLLRSGGLVLTLNADHVRLLHTDPAFLAAYRTADFITVDSQYIFWGLRWLKRPVAEKVCGSDLVPAFLAHTRADPAVKVFLLGAAPGVAERAAQRINARAGREQVVGHFGPSMNFVNDPAEVGDALRRIGDSGANVLMVGLGAPKQEVWLARHRAALPGVRVFMGVGATIDYEAGHVRRAPPAWRQCGMEWLYRVLTEPRRYAWRYVLNTQLAWWLLREKLRGPRPTAPGA